MLSAKAAATIEADRAATSWGLVGSGLAIIGAVLAVWIVTRVTSRQRERAGGIAALPARGATSGSPPTAATAPVT